MKTSHAEMAALAALAGAPAGLSPADLAALLLDVGVEGPHIASACEALLGAGHIALRGGAFELSASGAHELLLIHAAIQRALDPSPTTPGMEECASIPWLTTVQTCWVDAVSLNYAVDPDALRPLLPAPLEPEIFEGAAWVQILASRLRDMRPQGTLPLFGVNFHQVSYRAAVRYTSPSGHTRRGGFFVRSDTDNAVMRAVGNALVEFRFHNFGHADVALRRSRQRLDVSIAARVPHGHVEASLDLSSQGPPPTSRFRSLEHLKKPLVECYDAFGVDAEQRHIYVLTIDREPWDARFASPTRLRAGYFEQGPLGHGAARFDSALHIPRECPYRWRPLRRERF